MSAFLKLSSLPKIYIAICAMLLGVVFVDLYGVIIKSLGNIYSTAQLTMFRNAFAVIPLLILFFFSQGYADIFKNINKIRKDGLTVLVVEQNVRMALLLADYGYVIKDGVINVEGESKKLMYDESVKDSYLGGGGTTANV